MPKDSDGVTDESESSDRRVAAQQGHLGASVTGYMISGPLTFGGLGWLGDHALGTGFLLPVGIFVGIALSVYTVWLRYGTQ